MKKENKELLIESLGFVWIALMMVVGGIVIAFTASREHGAIFYGVLMGLVGSALLYMIIGSIVSMWKK